MATKLFVGGLSWDTTDNSLRNFFSSAGKVISANVIKDKYTGRSRGFGFVEMSTEEEAEEAKKLNGQVLDGRNISVNDARPQAPRGEVSSQGTSVTPSLAEEPEEKRFDENLETEDEVQEPTEK